MRGKRWADRLLGQPWILVLAVAVLVGIPIIALGRASEDDTRSRLRASQVAAASVGADAISKTLADRIKAVRDTMRILATNPTPESSQLAIALQRGDVAGPRALADLVQQPNTTSIRRAYVVRNTGRGITDAIVIASSPPEPGLEGKRLSELPGERGLAVRVAVGTGPAAFPGGISDEYAGDSNDSASGQVIAAGLRGNPSTSIFGGSVAVGGGSVSEALGSLVVELDLPRLFAAVAAPALSPSDDAYLIDGVTGRLTARARASIDLPLRELSRDPFIALALGSDKVARADVPDPLGGGVRLAVSVAGPAGGVTTSFTPGARVVFVRDTAAIDAETDTVLAQLAVARVVLVVLLLAGTYLIALASRERARASVQGERLRLARDLHDLLGHSLSVIAIKSQLALRLSQAGDARAGDEIADVERVARLSLDEVRQAVSGFRVPSLEAELAEAKATLSAAGIDCTIQHKASSFTPAVDGVLAWAVREGTTNVIRHAAATHCRILLERLDHQARLEIVNDGVTVPRSVDGNGLRGLRERAADRGGATVATPLPNGGFQLLVTLPL